MPSTRTLWTILFLAFILRLGGAAYWHRQAESEGRLFRLGDSDGYWVLANQIAQGEPYQYGSENARIFRTPLFPIVLAPFTYLSTQSRGVVGARAFGCAL